MEKSHPQAQREQKDYLTMLMGAEEGERHSTSMSVIGKVLNNSNEHAWEVLIPLLNMWNQTMNKPPLEDKEFQSMITYCSEKALQKRAENEFLAEVHQAENITEFKNDNSLTPLTLEQLINLPENPQGKFIVDKLIATEGINILSGKPGLGKTWILLCVALAVASGEALFETYDTKQGAVLILEEENGTQVLQERMILLGADKDLPIYFLSKRGLKIDRETDLVMLLNFVKEKNIALVILDPFLSIHSQEENSSSGMQVVLGALQKFNAVGATVLFTQHTRKSNFGGADDNIRGSSSIIGRADSHLFVTEAAKGSKELVVSREKTRRGEHADEAFTLSLVKTEEGVSLELSDSIPQKTEKKNKVEQAKDAIRLLFLEGIDMYTFEEMLEVFKKEKVDIGEKNIRFALRQMVQKEEISAERSSRGLRYFIVANQPESINVPNLLNV